MAADVTMYFNTQANKKVLRTRKALTFGASDTTKNFTLDSSCLISYAIVKMPNFSNAPTATLSIDDQDSQELYTQANLSNNSTNKVVMKVSTDAWMIPIDGTVTVKITLSGAPGGTGGTVYVTLFGV